jgi:hypothetical protein
LDFRKIKITIAIVEDIDATLLLKTRAQIIILDPKKSL